jgi:hypothetical protein
MAVPIKLPIAAQNESFADVTYRIEGELAPALQVDV